MHSSAGCNPANRITAERCANKVYACLTISLNANFGAICHRLAEIPLANLGRLNWTHRFGELGLVHKGPIPSASS